MVMKLLILLAIANQAMSCCLPDIFQAEILSDVVVFTDGFPRHQSHISFASNGSLLALEVRSEQFSGRVYACLQSKTLLIVKDKQCYIQPLTLKDMKKIEESRCAPEEGLQRYPLRLVNNAPGVVLVGKKGPVNIEAVASPMGADGKTCEPSMLRLRTPIFESLSVFGNFSASPNPKLFELPDSCKAPIPVPSALKKDSDMKRSAHFGFSHVLRF